MHENKQFQVEKEVGEPQDVSFQYTTWKILSSYTYIRDNSTHQSSDANISNPKVAAAVIVYKKWCHRNSVSRGASHR